MSKATRQQARKERQNARAAKRNQKKQDKKNRKEAGIKGLGLLRFFRGKMVKQLQRRFSSRNIQTEYKGRFQALVLEYYKAIVWPNRDRIRDFSSDSFIGIAPFVDGYEYQLSLPNLEDIDYLEKYNSSDDFAPDVIKVGTSIIKAILNFFKSIKEDERDGVPLGALGDIAGDLEDVEDEVINSGIRLAKNEAGSWLSPTMMMGILAVLFLLKS